MVSGWFPNGFLMVSCDFLRVLFMVSGWFPNGFLWSPKGFYGFQVVSEWFPVIS